MKRISRLLPVAAMAAAVACSDAFKPTRPIPTVDGVAGTYHATFISQTSPSGRIDYLSAGSHINVELRSDGTMFGDMLIKGAAPSGGDLTADLTGFWTIDGRYVRLQPIVVTILGDVAFSAYNVPLLPEPLTRELTGSRKTQDGYFWIHLTRE